MKKWMSLALCLVLGVVSISGCASEKEEKAEEKTSEKTTEKKENKKAPKKTVKKEVTTKKDEEEPEPKKEEEQPAEPAEPAAPAADPARDSCIALLQSQAANYSSYFMLDANGDGVRELILHRIDPVGLGNSPYAKYGDCHYYDIYAYSGGSWALIYNTAFQGKLLVPGPGQGFYGSSPVNSMGEWGITHYVMQGNSFTYYFVGDTRGPEVSQEAVQIENSYGAPYEFGMSDYSGI